jgi:hypothetical protein
MVGWVIPFLAPPSFTKGKNLRVLDLFAGLGGWSSAFVDRGHEVLMLDSDTRFNVDIHADILQWQPSTLPWQPDIILASPPCESFSVLNIGKNWTRETDIPSNAPKTESARLGLALVNRTVEIIKQLQPAFFIIENPRAKLRKLEPLRFYDRRTVTYCQYGLTTMKPTDLWGGFPPSLVLRLPCKAGMPCHVAAPSGSNTPGSIMGMKDKAERAKIPYELSLEICLAAEIDLQ